MERQRLIYDKLGEEDVGKMIVVVLNDVLLFEILKALKSCRCLLKELRDDMFVGRTVCLFICLLLTQK